MIQNSHSHKEIIIIIIKPHHKFMIGITQKIDIYNLHGHYLNN